MTMILKKKRYWNGEKFASNLDTVEFPMFDNLAHWLAMVPCKGQWHEDEAPLNNLEQNKMLIQNYSLMRKNFCSLDSKPSLGSSNARTPNKPSTKSPGSKICVIFNLHIYIGCGKVSNMARIAELPKRDHLVQNLATQLLCILHPFHNGDPSHGHASLREDINRKKRLLLCIP